LARRLAEALREEEFDLILGIARGGLIPTALLAQALSVRDILTAAVMFYEGEETLPEPVFLPFPPDPLLFGKRVLVVDDVWDSGRTAFAVKERVRQAGGVPLVATLHFKPGRNQVQDRPDFYAEETEAWVVYPWAVEVWGKAQRPGPRVQSPTLDSNSPGTPFWGPRRGKSPGGILSRSPAGSCDTAACNRPQR
jgi:hypoxanthine phosphoribosyltransferase